MIEKNKIENVWFIENNELKNANKVVTKINYKETEIPILKEEREQIFSNILIKDKNNSYWNLGIAPIRFQNFIDTLRYPSLINRTNPEMIEYCDNMVKAYSDLDLERFFSKKIQENRYFNKCELKYISLYMPDLYDKAKQSRENHISKLETQRKIEQEEWQKEKQNEVNTTNEVFEKKLYEIKESIKLDKQVEIVDLTFYKDGKYENGKTTQNCILYLAKQYGINIPLATQGFINNRLVSYDFGNGNFLYKVTDKNKRASEVMHKYLRQISKCVKDESKQKTEQLKEKVKEMKGGVL